MLPITNSAFTRRSPASNMPDFSDPFFTSYYCSYNKNKHENRYLGLGAQRVLGVISSQPPSRLSCRMKESPGPVLTLRFPSFFVFRLSALFVSLKWIHSFDVVVFKRMLSSTRSVFLVFNGYPEYLAGIVRILPERFKTWTHRFHSSE